MDMIFYTTTTRHTRQVRIRSAQLIDSCCILYFSSRELRTLQASGTHLHPIFTANFVAMRPPQPATRDCTSSKKLGSIYIHVFKEIGSYLYKHIQRNQVLFIYTCSRKLGPIYIHMFKEIRSYLYTHVKRNQVKFIYRCSKKLGPVYMHVFKEIKGPGWLIELGSWIT